jgi:uncharacterized protein (DUF433 family)
MDLPDFLTRTKFDDIRLTGSRIGLLHVVRYFNQGASPEMIVARFPTLRLAHVYKVIAFYLDNRAPVEEYVLREEEELERQRATGHHLDIETLRARLEERRKASQKPAGV